MITYWLCLFSKSQELKTTNLKLIYLTNQQKNLTKIISLKISFLFLCMAKTLIDHRRAMNLERWRWELNKLSRHFVDHSTFKSLWSHWIRLMSLTVLPSKAIDLRINSLKDFKIAFRCILLISHKLQHLAHWGNSRLILTFFVIE